MSEVLAGVALLLRTDALEEGTAAEVERYAESLAALATLYPGPVHHATGVHGLARPSREAMAQGWAAQIRAAVGTCTLIMDTSNPAPREEAR